MSVVVALGRRALGNIATAREKRVSRHRTVIGVTRSRRLDETQKFRPGRRPEVAVRASDVTDHGPASHDHWLGQVFASGEAHQCRPRTTRRYDDQWIVDRTGIKSRGINHMQAARTADQTATALCQTQRGWSAGTPQKSWRSSSRNRWVKRRGSSRMRSWSDAAETDEHAEHG